MDKEPLSFLHKLLDTPSPTGFERPIQKVVRERMRSLADSIEGDLHGNLIVALNPKAKRKIMLAGHCDQIGFMVKHITKDGYLYLAPLGGIDVGVVFGARVTIHSKHGAVFGVIGRKPIHHQVAEERERVKLDLDKVWVDIGAKDKRDAEKRVSIADPVTFELGAKEFGNGLISAPGLDDKVGLFIAMEALRLARKAKKLPVGLYAVSTVQEEVGLRGARTAAYSIDPEIGIAIDVTFASDNPGQENSKATPVKLGAGPAIYMGPNVNPILGELLVATAKKNKIPYQPLPESRLLGNDANAIQVSRGGVAAASLGIACRYLHTQVEVCSLKDLENAAKLLAKLAEGLDHKVDLRPS